MTDPDSGSLTPAHSVPELSKAAHLRYARAVKAIRADFEKVNSALYRISENLKKIVDEKLYYCGNYSTFADFCQGEFGKTRQAMYQIIQSHDVLDNLLEAGVPEEELPPTERLCRAIRKASPNADEQARIWRSVNNIVKARGRSTPQVTDVEAAAAEVLSGDPGQAAIDHQQEELIRKFEGLDRSLKIGIAFDVLTPKYRRRLLGVLAHIAESVTIMIKSLNSAAVAERAPKAERN